MAARWRLRDDVDHPITAAGQMAADLALLDAVAAGGEPALRLYQWHAPALSLGRFQPDGDIDHEACAARGVEVVRRPTGGRALLHGGDLTYAVALPRPAGPAGAVDALYERLAAGIIAGLTRVGVGAAVAHHEGETAAACFSSMRGSDIRAGDRKLVGSAQVHRDGAVLQHGSILRHRLGFDETDLFRWRSDAERMAARDHLRSSTVTLDELGVEVSLGSLAAALTCGFAESLDLDFTSKEPAPGFVAAGEGPQ